MINYRTAEERDTQGIFALINELAIYEKDIILFHLVLI
jgi:hypothetical protein